MQSVALPAAPVVVPVAAEAPVPQKRRKRAPAASAEAPKAPVPAFLVDVQSTLENLDYKKKDAALAVQRSTGETFEARLKCALDLLKLPDAKLTA
jgi:hypothetical protein